MVWFTQPLTTSGYAYIALLCGFLALLRVLKSKNEQLDKFWASIPVVGLRGTWFSWTRAVLRAVLKSSENALEGYKKYSKQGSFFAIPSTGVGAIVVLPPSQLHVWNKPEGEVTALQSQNESIQPEYTMGDKDLFDNPIHFDIVRLYLTKDMDYFANVMAEELDAALRDYWGVSKEWRTVGAWDTCAKVISRAANRVFVEHPLCRDETLLEQTKLYATAVYACATIITAFPKWIRPFVGPLVALPAQKYLSRCKKILIPFVENALKNIDEKNEDGPKNALHWLVKRSAKAGPTEMNASRIAQRLLILDLVSIFTTSQAFTNCLLDLCSSSSKEDFIFGLREETNRISTEYNGLSTKEAVDKLYRIDSCVRESMRCSAFGIVALPRTVARQEGLDLGNGARIPAGVRLGIPMKAIHHDDRYYENPLDFDAFRFSRAFESLEDEGQVDHKREHSYTLTGSFLTYGYGKHACSGRWFASLVMKQALAYVIQNYDVECVDGKPKRTAILNMVMPPTGDQIRIRRRA